MAGLYSLLSEVWRLMGSRHLGLISAGVAFFGILAVFPALAALIAIWGFFADPLEVSRQLQELAEFLPAEAFDILRNQTEALVQANTSRFGWTTALSLGAALWSARAGVAALVQGINAIFGLENRGGVLHQVTALVLTVAFVGSALMALAAGIVLPVVLAFVPLGPFEAGLITLVQWAIAPAATVLGIGMAYRYGPNVPGARPRLFSPGLWLAVALWLAASQAFSVYLTNFGNYNQIYGSIGAVVALMMWLYISAYAVLIGAALNAALAARRAGTP
ncbi:YihY/virulence factor BrkB family protein [Ruixingdingia sedimenti]|uniref:YihY/virulence factor BrkB family protein n=1 Tax=Ruixingdingia sedimenti TaxID=3073604 RepID=A0ABU1F692_9RHOB|nr:YihY/virulence factor BrkB family protein [Xinfangfangia sp. LG-4]MDR5652385.1 YihY/virulence factor BrkB family protein [Xinfangfangia sp. LG-4]